MMWVGYIIVWVASRRRRAAQWELHQNRMLTAGHGRGVRPLAGGIPSRRPYQLTPVKGACLIRCRVRWDSHDQLAWGHSARCRWVCCTACNCLGCCWLLMCCCLCRRHDLVWV